MGVTPVERWSAVPRAVVNSGAAASRTARMRAGVVTLLETFRLALESLRAHKLRSFLTLLGVILAVTTLVTVMSVVTGMNTYVADRIANLGANVFLVDRFGIITSQDEFIKAQKRPLIRMDDYEACATRCRRPVRWPRKATATYRCDPETRRWITPM